jgi:V8-like Glu-specific endopeptidase
MKFFKAYLCLLLFIFPNLEAQVAVVKKGKASTAYLKVSGGSGTAFCIHQSGLFLTNAHVVEEVSHSEKVTLILNSGESNQKAVKATVVRKSSEDDLALLKADSENEKFNPLSIGNSNDSYETQEVFTFGFPLGSALASDEGSDPAISVTMGRINSLRKKEGILDMLQLDAVLTKGNSGGPILNTSGEVVGVVVSGVMGLGLNFAIPTNKLVSFLKIPHIEFIPPKLNLNNVFESLPYKAIVSSSLNKNETYQVSLSLKTSAGTKELQLQKNGNIYLAQAPLHKKPNQKVRKLKAIYSNGEVKGTVSKLNLSQSGKAFPLEKIKKINLNKTHEIITNQGNTKKGNVSGLKRVKLNLGDHYIYINLEKSKEIFFEKDSPISQVDYILKVSTGEDDYSEEGVISIDGISTNDLKSKLSTTSSVPPGPELTPEEEVLPIDGIKVISVPSTINDSIRGGNGKYLILSMTKLKKLAIYSISQSKILHYINTPESNILYSASRTKLVVIAPTSGIISRYDLFTGKKELTKKLPFSGIPQRAVMGMSSEGPLLIRWAVGSSALDRAHYSFLDLFSLKMISEKPIRSRNSSYRNQEFLRASADGSVFGAWCTSHSPSGLIVLTKIDNTLQMKSDHTSVGQVVPNSSGDQIFTGKGIYTNELKRIFPQYSGHFIPAITGSYFFGMNRGKSDRHSSHHNQGYTSMNVFSLGTDTALAKHSFPKEAGTLSPSMGFSQKTDFTLDKRINFHPSLNRIVYIPTSNDKLVVQVFSIESILRKSGIDYLFVSSQALLSTTPNRNYKYQIKVLSKSGGVKYVLESGPSGMTVSSKGLVSWSTPRDFTEEESVIILIKDSSGQEVYHSFTIKPT